MRTELHLISSMATQALLADLAAQFEVQTGTPVRVESVGGVDAAKRVQAGETFDIVMLASNAIDTLMASRMVHAGSRVDIVHSGVSVAVQAGAAQPDIGSEAAVRATVLAAPRLAYSTGPSGVQLAKLFERWGIADTIAPRIVTAPPGVPVGSLVAAGQVNLGFQQTSELMSLPGITVLGPLPPAIQIITTFSAALAATGNRRAEAQTFIDFMASAPVAALKIRHGMTAA